MSVLAYILQSITSERLYFSAYGRTLLIIGAERRERYGYVVTVAGHKLGIPGLLLGFRWTGKTHGIVREFCATSGKNCDRQNSFCLSFKYLCKITIFSLFYVVAIW